MIYHSFKKIFNYATNEMDYQALETYSWSRWYRKIFQKCRVPKPISSCFSSQRSGYLIVLFVVEYKLDKFPRKIIKPFVGLETTRFTFQYSIGQKKENISYINRDFLIFMGSSQSTPNPSPGEHGPKGETNHPNHSWENFIYVEYVEIE